MSVGHRLMLKCSSFGVFDRFAICFLPVHVCCVLSVVCCLLCVDVEGLLFVFDVGCGSFFFPPRRLLLVGRCSLCLLFVCWWLRGVRCLLICLCFVGCALFDACCLLLVLVWLLVIVCCWWYVVR